MTSDSDRWDCDKMPPLWNEDGDTILRVSEDGITYEFRIHRCILSVHSPVFKDMFRAGDPSQSLDANGVPTITLHDPVADLRVFLRALYSPFRFFERNDSCSDFDDNLALFKLAHKYQVLDIQVAMTRILKKWWPLNFSRYSDENGFIDSRRTEHCIRVINAARQTEAVQLLPTAFYELAFSRVEEWCSSDLKEQLSLEDLSRLMLGRECVIRRMAELCANDGPQWLLWNKDPEKRDNIFSIKEPCLAKRGHTECHGSLVCQNVLENIQFRLGSCLLNGGSLLSALLTPLDNQAFPVDAACDSCSKWANHLVENKLEEIWHNVPVDFDLPVHPEEYDEIVC